MANRVHPPGGTMFGEHGIMSTDIIPAPVRRPTKEDNYHGEPCASPAGNMSERHGIMSTDVIPALICRPTKGRTIPWQIMCTPRGETCRNDMV